MYDTTSVGRAFSRAADSYGDASVLQQAVEDELLTRLTTLNPSADTIVDLGAGPGRASRSLAGRPGNPQVVAVDLASGMLEGWSHPGVQRICADAAWLPLADGCADLVWSNLMLQWSPDPGRLFAEVRRSLRPEGCFLFSTFGPLTLTELRSAWAAVDAGSHVSDFIDMHDLGDGLLAAGFSDPVMDSQLITLTYGDVRALMMDLKAWGASNRRQDRPRGMMGKRRMKAMMAEYERHRADDRIPATFEVIYGFARGAPTGRPVRQEAGEVATFPVDSLRGSRRQ
ncbi:MAG: malonyl-ACP O-methyltransferase BioC [Pseudomonadota bacterium]